MKNLIALFLFTIVITLVSCSEQEKVVVEGQLKKWHKVSLVIEGPEVHENDVPNPFLNYKLDVTFSNGETSYTVPGYFAADGEAAESSAEQGNKWKVNFCPNKTGTWNYEISFKNGKAISVAEKADDISPVELDGYTGSFEIDETDKTGRDFRGKGRLIYDNGHYLKFAATGEYFLKGGADSPENFLGYIDFDGTYYGGNRDWRKGESAPNEGLHSYEPHIKDWNEGDPVWQEGKGKGIIGALNYLASKGMNSVYFLTMNILGDGDDTWPYTDRNERYRFDCSKLDQWEIVFSHMDSLGIMLHIVLQETENEAVLDAGALDVQRKLYLREMIARFAHHPAITWNVGEEHGSVHWSPYGQTTKDTKEMAQYLSQVNPYNEFVVMHTHSYEPDRHDIMAPMLGFEFIEGPSIQVHKPENSHDQTLKWRKLSVDSLHPWVVCLDEIGPAYQGALPDEVDPEHDTIRYHVLWGNLMAGGAGVEWYFGYRFAHNDLNCEDWRSRDNLWDQTNYALSFFREYLPFWEMQNMNNLVSDGYCFAKSNEIYALYIPQGGRATLNLANAGGSFSVSWYDPEKGGDLLKGSVQEVTGGKVVSVGEAPGNLEKDWVCIVKK